MIKFILYRSSKFQPKISLRLKSIETRIEIIKWLIGGVERSTDEQEIYIKTGKSKSYNLVHLKRLAAHIFIFKGDEWPSKN